MDRGQKVIRSYDPCSLSSAINSCEGKIGEGTGGVNKSCSPAPPRVNRGPATGTAGRKRSITSLLWPLLQPVATVDGPGDGPSPPPQPPPITRLFQCPPSLPPLPLAHIFPSSSFSHCCPPLTHPDTASTSRPSCPSCPSPPYHKKSNHLFDPVVLGLSPSLHPSPSSPAKKELDRIPRVQKESVSIGRVLLLFSFLSTSFPGRSQRTLLFFLVKRLRGGRLCAPTQGSQPGF